MKICCHKKQKMAEEGFACVKLYPYQANKSQNNSLLALSFEKFDLEAWGKLLILLLFARFLSTIFHIENCCKVRFYFEALRQTIFKQTIFG